MRPLGLYFYLVAREASPRTGGSTEVGNDEKESLLSFFGIDALRKTFALAKV